MPRFRLLSLALIAATAAGLALAAPVSRSGVVTAITGQQLPTTLTLETGTSEEQATITADTVFTSGGEEDPSFLDDPFRLFGRYVEAVVDSDTGAAASVALGPEFVNSGNVSSVSASAPPAMITLQTTFSGDLKLQITEQTLVDFNNEKPIDLRDLRKSLAFVSYDPTTFNVLGLGAFGGFKRVKGELLFVDADFAELEVRTGRGSLFLSADMFPTIEDGSEARVIVDGQETWLDALSPGMSVVVDYEDADFPFAVVIQAITPATSSLKGVAGEGSLTDQTLLVKSSTPSAPPAGQASLSIDSNTRIELNGKRVPLSAVPEGARLNGTIVQVGGALTARRLKVRARRR